MIKMFMLFSHRLTSDQANDAKENFKIDEFIYLPGNLQGKWSNVPPNGELPDAYLDDIKKFLFQNKSDKNYVLVEGEYGLTHSMVNWCFKNGFIPVYSTTTRNSIMEGDKDGNIVNKHIFRHVQFRLYKAV